MLRDHDDAAHSDAEWQGVLQAGSLGQLVVAAPGADPLAIPAPYTYHPGEPLRVHLDRRNPVFEALAETDRALFSVVRDVAFVPSAWNRRPETEAQWAAPTVYFAAVQLIGRASVIDDPAELGEIIARLVARLQPEVEIASIVPGPTPFGRMLGAVRGVRLDVEEVRVRIKAGGDKAVEHRLRIADALAERGAEADLGARAHLLRRLGTER